MSFVIGLGIGFLFGFVFAVILSTPVQFFFLKLRDIVTNTVTGKRN